MKWTNIGVVVFMTIALLAYCHELKADTTISLGKTVLNSNQVMMEVGRDFGKWEVAGTMIGHGDTKRGDTGPRFGGSVSRIVKPNWCLLGGQNYYRIGLAYIDAHPLVGSVNYRLGVGVKWKVAGLEYVHYSSAGANQTNTGIDAIQFRIPF